MSSLVTVSPHLYMEALHVHWPVRKWFNSRSVGQSLAVVRWGPPLLHSWLRKSALFPLSRLINVHG